LPAILLQGKRNKSVSTPQIEDRASRRESAHQGVDAAVAVLEPEGMAFYFKAGFVPSRGVRDLRVPFGKPDTAFAELQICSDFINANAFGVNGFHPSYQSAKIRLNISLNKSRALPVD
jgi:hypothetical protein